MQIYIRVYSLCWIKNPVYNGSVMYTWDDSYAIALALHERRPDANLDQVSLGMIYHWTLELDDFQDDPELANDGILMAIYQEWFEEVNSL